MIRLLTLLFSIGFASIIFAQVPNAQFSANQLTVCAGFPISFTNLSTYGGAAVISTNWDFGEGGQSTLNDPVYTYMSAGTYQVLLTVISSGGTDFELKLNYITVYSNPTASFVPSGDGCTVPFSVTFANTSTTGAGITYDWDFGNGQTSILQNPAAVTYNAAGNFPVALTVTNTTTGCTGTITQTLVVSDYAAGITSPATACTGQAVAITDGSTVGANTWAWDSGDGQLSNSQNPSFTYATPGTYTITLNSQNTTSGCSDVATQNITVLPLPTPTFTAAPTSGCAPLNVTYTNTSGAGVYTWNFGNGSTFDGTNPPVQTYAADGSYPVSLTMTAPNGCVVTTTINNMITVSPPVAAFSTNTPNGCAPLSVQLTDQSSASNPVDDPIVSWVWNFGDGSPVFNGQNPPAHIYGIGTFDVSLTITTQNGCTETTTISDFIQVGMIDLVDFSLFPINECAKQDITFTNLSVISTPHDPSEVLYTWDFGDGGSSTEENPVYNYPIDTGFFDIQLIVEFRGCTDTLSRTDQIYIKAPISLFTVTTLYCNPASFPVRVNVMDNAIAGANTDNVDMIWSWGVPGDPDDLLNAADVFDANQGDTAHDYMAYGTYTIKQLIHNYTTGCTDSTEQTIFISSMDAGLSLLNDSICNNTAVSITSTSVFTDPNATFEYDMGNGVTVMGDPLNYTYTVPGTYDIKLTATNAVGCSDSATFIGFHVLDPPLAGISASDSAGCLPITAVYTNLSASQGNGLPLSSFLWTFPDGSTQTTNSLAQTTSFAFSTEGNFTTTIVATDQFGCSSAPASVPMMITNPTVNFIIPAVVCDQDIFTAVSTSSGFGMLSYSWNIDGVFITPSQNCTTSFDETPGPGYTNVPHDFTLIVTDGNGCIDSLTQTIRVDLPKADLNYVASGATANALGEYTCPPVFETYTDSSSAYGMITSWNWVFGDGKSSAFQDPNNTYIFPGVYTMSLNITDQYGCTADTVLVDYLTILGPTGDIDWISVGDVCEHNYLFSATNLVFVDSIVWNMDDGTSVFDSVSFTHQYAVGSFDPTGTLIDSLGCQVVYPMNTLVVPSIVLSSNAGPDQAFCGDSTSMSANTDPNGIGTWTVISGAGTITAVNSPTTDITAIGIGTNRFVWTVTNACDTVSDTIDIVITDVSTIPDAGPDQFLCSTVTNLAANSPSVGVGTWSLVSGTGTITDPSDPLTGITALGLGMNTFVWTISNVCSVSTDTVRVMVETIPTVANAGPDQLFCVSTAVLAGNVALVGTGTWTSLDAIGTITDPSDPGTDVTGLTLGLHTYVWSISNSCATTTDTVLVTGVDAPTTSVTGPDIVTCITDTIISANSPQVGTGVWTLVSGTGSIGVDTDSVTTVSGLSSGMNVFQWTITSICGISSDQISILIENAPTVANAGADTSICGNSLTMNANTALVGTGSWSLISGTGTIVDTNSAATSITGLSIGQNVFEWTISNSCGTSSDQVIVTCFANPPVADAGPDQTFCGNVGVLDGNDPLNANGTWTLISGLGTVTIPTDSTSAVTGLGVGQNIFIWTVTNICSTVSDQVMITVETTPTIADAGPDQVVCGDATNLAGSPALVGTGVWTLISGSGTITSPNSETSGITGLSVGVNIFQWTVSNTCDTTADQVVITQFEFPTVATAGPDQFMCGSDSTNTTLAGNPALIGNGFWTLFSGSGTITDPTSATTTVTGLGEGANVFQWTISNGCGTSFDQVSLSIETTPTSAACGPPQTICGGTGMLSGNSALTGSGAWTLISGEGSINTISDSTSGVQNLGIGDNVFEWTISNSCGTSSAQMTITNVGSCPNEDSIANVLYFYVPNTFTPNGDGMNDVFLPQFTQGFDSQSFTLLIFDRWGELIFESHDASVGWIGTYGTGEEQVIVQDDTYTWKIKFTDTMHHKDHTVTGHVNMLR